MKLTSLFLVCMVTSQIKAPWEADFFIRGKRVNKGFFIKHDAKTNRIFRIAIHTCLVDTFHVQPERSKRENTNTVMRCSEHYGNIMRDKKKVPALSQDKVQKVTDRKFRR